MTNKIESVLVKKQVKTFTKDITYYINTLHNTPATLEFLVSSTHNLTGTLKFTVPHEYLTTKGLTFTVRLFSALIRGKSHIQTESKGVSQVIYKIRGISKVDTEEL